MASSSQSVLRAISEELEEIGAGLSARLPGVDTGPLAIFGRIGAVAGLYRTFYERFLAGSGLTHPEYQVLGILHGRGPRSPTELARSVRQSTAGMTKTLDRLQRSGLVDRRSHASDRRRVEIGLTPSGSRTASSLIPAELEAQRTMLARIGAEGGDALPGMLDRLIGELATGIESVSAPVDETSGASGS